MENEALWKAKSLAIYMCYKYGHNYDVRQDGKLKFQVSPRQDRLPRLILLKWVRKTFHI